MSVVSPAVPEPTQDMSEVVGSVTLSVSSAGPAVMPATLQTLPLGT